MFLAGMTCHLINKAVVRQICVGIIIINFIIIIIYILFPCSIDPEGYYYYYYYFLKF